VGGTKMLLASQTPLIQTPPHPPVSLHVKEGAGPTRGMYLDVWLDCVINGVRDAVICWHQDAVVRGVAVARADELPEQALGIGAAEMDRKARHVIKWLQEQCDRDGGSYWLYRGEHDDKLMLFDMSDLPAREPSEFTVTVAIVCLRLAPTVQNRSARRELLLRAVRPLSMQTHPSVYAALHEVIAETYVDIDGKEGVRTYDSIEAETFVLPSGDKRRDTEMASRHLSLAFLALSRAGGGGRRRRRCWSGSVARRDSLTSF